MRIKKRADNVFDRYGESFLINGTTPAKGFFQLLDQVRMNMYFDNVEQSFIQRPALVVMVSGDTQVQLNNTIARDGRTYSVKRISNMRVKDTVILKYLALT